MLQAGVAGRGRRRTTGRPQGRGRHSSQDSGVDRQAAIYFHPNLNSIFARPLSSASLSRSLRNPGKRGGVSPSARQTSERGTKERRKGRAFYHVDAREIKPSRNGRGSGEASREMGGVEAGWPRGTQQRTVPGAVFGEAVGGW